MQPKSKLAATLFAFLLGNIGVHSFYLGYKAKGAWHIVLYSCGIAFWFIPYVGWPVAAGCVLANNIWSLVEAIMIVSKRDYYDAYGVVLEWPH